MRRGGGTRVAGLIGAMVLALFMVVMDNSILNVALPYLSSPEGGLGAGVDELQWVINAYVLSFGAFIFVWAVIGGRLGQRRAILAATALFGVFSMLAGLSTSPLVLIILRALMGVAAAGMQPTSLSIINTGVPESLRARAIGLWSAAAGLAVVSGPIFGGLLLEHLGEEEIGELVARIAHSLTIDVVGGLEMVDALRSGIERVGEALAAGLPGQRRLTGSGIEVCDARVLSLRPEGDIEKALQTPLREQLQAEADRALYERRALAVEREQRISVNELASKLDLSRRREELVAQEGANARREAEEKASAALVDTNASAERRRIRSEAEAAETERLGRATNEVEAARLSALASIGTGALRAIALQEAARHLPRIGQVNLAPDMLQSLLAGLLPRAEAEEGRS